MAFNFNKKKNQINTSSTDNSTLANTPSTSDNASSASDDRTTVFRRGVSNFGKSMATGAKSMMDGAKKVKQEADEFKTFCGNFPITTYPWLRKYYKKFGGDYEYAIKHISSDDGRIAVIHFQSGRVGEYNIKANKFEPRAFQWLSDTNYDYTPPKEKAKASKDDSAHSAQVKSKNSGIYFVVPNGYRISYRSSSNEDKTEPNDGSKSGGR